ncbi:WXG100 family type VII secretion target [Kineosporia babensis]|uniref:ESAT-6-like protein n=1 Tax=Kineosporia babensis TaxID=499548 RepID=A0A9X1NA62_9ACTN|nr:WXG100 family type VII secretion target [Kineosporia babensis]MCD5309994.1 WXG100 family type VII secretion target [Kineosporia babensis]
MLSYNFQELNDLSSSIGKAHSGVEGLRGDVKSAAGQLQADWSGSAGESWAVMQQKWDTACDNLVTALNKLSTTVASNSSDMSVTEDGNAKLFGR